MAEINQFTRIRAFLDTWFVAVVIALLLVTLVLGWWTYQINAIPEVEEDERLIEQWTESTAYNHSAELENESVAFQDQTVVSNRPIYYTNLSSQLDGEYIYSYAADSGEVSVTTDTYLLIRAGELENQRIVETYWEIAEPLAQAETDSLSPDEDHIVEYSVDINHVLDTISAVEQQLGAREGIVDVRVISTSTIDGTVDGGAVQNTYESHKIMVVDPTTFRINQLDTISEEHQTYESVEVIVEASATQSYGSILLFGVAVMSLLSMLFGRHAGYIHLTDEERELIQIEQDRDRFSEWITMGTFPSERDYEQTVLVDDLEGLVDVAIDTNKRVIEDEQLGVSTVLDDEYIYLYVRPDSPARDWLVNYADTTLDNFDHGL